MGPKKVFGAQKSNCSGTEKLYSFYIKANILMKMKNNKTDNFLQDYYKLE